MNSLRILIVADDPLARTGLASLLTTQLGCVVVGQVAGENLAVDADIYRPDLVVWDLGWSASPASLAALRAGLEDITELGLPVATLLPDSSAAADAWGAGARGLLPRDIDLERLLSALTAVAQGLAVIDRAYTASLLPAAPGPLASQGAPHEDLTPREIEVLRLMAEGLPNKTIARQLAISEHTVKFHVNSLMGKLGAQSRTDAVVRATRQGLIIL